AATLLDHRDGLSYFALCLVVAQQDNRVRQIACVNWRLHLIADNAMVSPEQDAHDMLLTQVAQNLMQLSNEKALFRHGIQVAIQAIDDHHQRVLALNGVADGLGELAWRQLRGINSLYRNPALFHMLAQIDSKRRAAGHQRGLALVEDEESSVLAPGGSSGCKLRGERRFSRSW